MLRKIDDPVGLLLVTSARKPGARSDLGRVRPWCVDWAGKRYEVTAFGMHHSYRLGTRKIHVFSVSTDALDMRVEMDAETLECRLTEISDGLAD